MAEVSTIYRSLRQRKNKHQPKIAPIAANYENCRGCFEQVCLALRSNSSSSIADLADDGFGKLQAWGRDSGASNRLLDHTLRKASRIAKLTTDLLSTLCATLVKSKSCLHVYHLKENVNHCDAKQLWSSSKLCHSTPMNHYHSTTPKWIPSLRKHHRLKRMEILKS
jgi:hypothetical protein